MSRENNWTAIASDNKPASSNAAHGVLFIATIMALHGSGIAQLVNYENDKDLARAMTHDSVLATNPELISQAQAEHWYLQYLSHATDKSQRAKVYFQLGYIHAAGARPNTDDKRDHAKARRYMEAAIEANPTGLCQELVFARTHLASLQERREDRISKRLEVYQWLATLDERALAENLVLPQPRPKPAHDAAAPAVDAMQQAVADTRAQAIARLAALVQALRRTEAVNIVADASSSQFPETELRRIAGVLPDADELAVMATKQAEFIRRRREDSLFRRTVDEIDKLPVVPDGTTSHPFTTAPSLRDSKRNEQEMRVIDNQPIATAWPYWLAAVILVLTVGMVGIYICRRMRRHVR